MLEVCILLKLSVCLQSPIMAVTLHLRWLGKSSYKRALPLLPHTSHRDISLTTSSMQKFEMSQCFTVILFYHYGLYRIDNRCGEVRGGMEGAALALLY